MRVLYCNPVFFEYRVPFYQELIRLFHGEFYVIYSPIRYKMCNKELLCKQIKNQLGNHAIPLTTEHLFDTYSKQWDKMPNIEKGKRIPFTRGLMRTISKVNPDILITEGYFQWTPLVLLYGIFHHIPVYMGYERTLHTERNASIIKTFQRKIFNKKITGFLVNGQETKYYLESLGVPSKKIHIGGMSADSSLLKKKIVSFSLSEKQNFKLSFNIENTGLLYMFSGRISEAKGVNYLLKAWEKHIKKNPKDRIILIGHGDKYDYFKEKYKKETSIYLLGAVDYANIYRYYAIADVFILPTLQDNWSLVIPEAMACGLPVATSIYNGCHIELVHKGENGITFDTYKEETLIAALDYFHHQDLKIMGENSIKLEKKFSTENCAQRVFKALTQI
ncbi:glycosyltransferase family 4 protein [Bacteroides clarus]|uniref:glycosyltransferase family 4 protein n=1 Tax=Bacteroides clarus TaxID=626929 RepID=UPI002666138A|nr:glycosyltransferase family 4 protein [Bacteroides clarus]